jgi:hypothetical protein
VGGASVVQLHERVVELKGQGGVERDVAVAVAVGVVRVVVGIAERHQRSARPSLDLSEERARPRHG